MQALAVEEGLQLPSDDLGVARPKCTPESAQTSLPAGPIRLISLNISHGRGSALNQLLVNKEQVYANLDRVAALLASYAPDVVALQEADDASGWSGSFDHVGYVADQINFACRMHGAHSRSLFARYGTALLTREQPVAGKSVRFASSWVTLRKGYVWVTLDWPVAEQPVLLTVASVHFDFLRKGSRDQQLDQLIEGLRQAPGPLIILGDFNSSWDQQESHVRRLREELDLRVYEPEQAGQGTYKSTEGRRLDWILVSADLDFKAYEVLPEQVSDHLAVYAEVEYKGQP